MTYEEFEFCYDQASRDLDDNIDSMREKVERMGAYRRVLDEARDAFLKYNDLREQVDSQQQEIDDLHEQLEAKEGEIASLQQQHQVEIETLQRQLLEAQNVHLQTEKQHLEAEVKAKPLEIHNHFESGSSSQVFNDKVHGKFEKLMKSGKSEKSKKTEKKRRWKKIARKIL